MTNQLLEERLQALAVEAPDAGRVVSRVLAARPAPRTRRSPRLALSAVAALVMVVLVAYFVPAAGTVLARVPIAGDIVGARDHVTLVGDTKTVNGYTVTLVAAYADATRTELIFNTSPAASLGLGVHMKDQFGRSYTVSSSFTDLTTGDTQVELDPLGWPAQLTGARITVEVSELHPNGDPTVPPATGPWTLHATLGVDKATALALPEPATLGRAHLQFTSVVYTPGSIAIDFEISGVSFEDLQLGIPATPKPQPAFAVDLLDANGKSTLASSEERDDWRGVIHVHVLGDRTSGTRYSFVATYLGERVERALRLS